MKNCSTKAIILGKRDLGENHKLVFLYTEALGKLKVIAKGARKINSRFTGHLETLRIVQVSLYFGPKNTILTEIVSLHPGQIMSENLPNASAALQIAEITEKLVFEKQEIPDLLPLLETTILTLHEKEMPETITICYIIKFLKLLGMSPDYSSINTKLEEKYLKFLHYVESANYQNISKIKLKPEENITLKNFIKRLIEFQTERTINSFSL